MVLVVVVVMVAENVHLVQSSAPALSSVQSSGRTTAVVEAHVSISGVAMAT